MRLQHAAQQIAGFEKGIEHFRLQAQFALADAIEQVFQYVRGFGQIGETKGAGAALDGMNRPENGIELFNLGIGDIQPEEQVLHRREVLRRFLVEHLVEAAHVDGHVTLSS